MTFSRCGNSSAYAVQEVPDREVSGRRPDDYADPPRSRGFTPSSALLRDHKRTEMKTYVEK